MLSSLKKAFSSFRSWLSSSFYICILMNFIVILIVASSFFHHPNLENNSDIEDGGGDSEDYDLHSALSPSLSPPPAPPPMQNNPKQHLQEREPKEIAVAAAAAATIVTATTKSSESIIRTATTSVKSQRETEDTNGVKKVDEGYHQAVFSDFSRLTKAKEIKKAQTTNDGAKIRTTTKDHQGIGDINVAKITDDSFQASFLDLLKLEEAKEIKKVHSLDSSKQVMTIQNPIQEATTTTTKNGSKHEKRYQLEEAEKQLINEDGDEDDTMEATWRAINGGAKPQKKQLKKSETWAQPQTLVIAQERNVESEENMALLSSGGAVVKELRKSLTFNDAVSIGCRGGLRRDPSTNLEELNQRFEAFIQKFNNEMRLQRQESDQRYLDMISRGL